MAGAAAVQALARSGREAGDVDLIVVATSTALQRMPSVAAQVAADLHMTAPAAFDLNAACSGFCYALSTVDQAIRTGSARLAVVVGVDKMSDFLDWADPSSAVIFGDGAGACVVEASVPDIPAGIGPVVWGSVPDQFGKIVLDTAAADGPRPLFRQEGRAVFRWATTELAPFARLACERAGVQPSELGALVTHQANVRIVHAIARQLGVADAVVATDVVESGNTSAASIPTALSKLIDRGEVAAGSPVLLFGFGAGLAYAGQVIRCP
jgi:3-oxoacyl-[acyl-carrier-protein] synthase-3